MSPRPRPRGDYMVLGGVGLVLCAACCAGPILALISAIGLASGIASLVVPAFALVALAGAGGAWFLRRRQKAGCEPTTRVAKLAPPTVRPAADSRPRSTNRRDRA